MEMNPYQSPATISVVQPDQRHGNLPMVDGKCLVVAPGTVLPPVCVKTNQPASEDDLICRRFYWCPPWVGLMILLSGPLLVLLYFVARKKCPLTYGLRFDLRQKYRTRVILKLAATILLFFAIPFSIIIDDTVAPVIVLVLFLVAIVCLFVGNSPLKVVAYRKGMFWIEGFSDEFLANVNQNCVSEIDSRGQVR